MIKDFRPRPLAPLLLATCAAACVAAPERAPIDLAEVERHLELALSPPPELEGFTLEDGLGLDEAAALAAARHPALVAARAELGVADALLVVAGLWPDPTVGWSAVDWLVHGTTKDVLTGFSLNVPLPRPGEVDARRRLAESRRELARARILGAEWELARAVRTAWIRRAELEEIAAAGVEALSAVRETARFVEEGRRARASSAVDSALAALEVAEAELASAALERELSAARVELNRNLGLPPQTELVLAALEPASLLREPLAAPSALASLALRRRPEMRLALGEHEEAEEALALEAALGAPAISVGSALQVMLLFGTRWHRPALEVALRRRVASAARVAALAHELRAEVQGALRRVEDAKLREALARERLLPSVLELRRLVGEAREARSAPVTELLLVQRRALEAVRAAIEARWELARAALELEWALGPALPDEEPPESSGAAEVGA